jgi:thiol-disulfide isomerase/thioredoxin
MDTPAPKSGDGQRSRRQLCIAGLAAALISSTRLAAAVMPKDNDVPSFQSGRYQFTLLRPQQQLPSFRLFRLEGGTVDLVSLRGKPVLVNFWASWCAACRTELPTLDQQYENGWRGSVHVVAVSEDRSDRLTVERFVKALRLRRLPIFLDPNGYVASSGDNSGKAPFALYGMPITYLVSASGLIVGYIPGAADWSSPQANDLIDYFRDR